MTRLRQLSGAQRVAAFLLSLDKDAAAKVIAHLDEKIVVEVVEAMSRIDPAMTDPAHVRELDRELINGMRRPRPARIKSGDELRALLEQTLGLQQAKALFAKIEQRLLQERPFLAIEHEPGANIAKVLATESDTVAALVLAHLDPSLSAEVLAAFEGERALTLIRRMATLIPPGFDVLVAIARDLAERLQEIARQPAPPSPAVRLRTVAEVLNYARPEVEKKVLEGLDKQDAAMAAEIREFMFTWEDLAEVDRRAMQRILSSVDAHTLAIALKGSSPEVEENVLSNLSQRVAAMIREEREFAGPLPMRDVLAARGEMMKAVRSLLESGEFSPQRAGEQLVN